MPRNEEFDWIFDFTLQFLESDRFDAALMDFVDEKCLVFEDEEENKLVYTDIHREFCDHVESLISSNLSEVGITTELFLESCEKARTGRDINTTVFERLMAMEDFATFKKLMTKRNIELQMESIRSFIATSGKADAKQDESKAADAKGGAKANDDVGGRPLTTLEKEELGALQCFAVGDVDFDNMSEEEIQELLFQSLVEMEFLHRQEELEHAELERALLLSLAMEEERLSAMLTDLAATPAASTAAAAAAAASTAEDKQHAPPAADAQEKPRQPSADAQEKRAVAPSSPAKDAGAKDAPSATPATAPAAAATKTPLAPLAPLSLGGNLRLRSEAKPLPSIGAAPALAAAAELEEKKRAAEDALKRSAEQLAAQRRREEELRSTVSTIDAAEAERRAQHMQRQRELLVAKKKAEREAKLAQQAAADERADAKGDGKALDAKTVAALLQERTAEEKEVLAQGVSAADVAELRRQNLRLALAKRLKSDVRQDETAKQAALQESQFAQLDQKLRQVEDMREEHRKREALLAKQLEKQKQQIARNVELSAASLRGANA